MMRLWDRAEQTLIGLFGLGALCVGLWSVFSRYFATELSSGWGDEVIVYLVVWGVMIAASQLVRLDGHVRPDLVLRLMAPGVQRWFEALNCLVAMTFCGGLVWYGWQIVNTSWMLDERSSTGLSFPMYLYYLALPVGAGLMFLRYAIRLVRYLFFFDPVSMSVGHTIHEAPADIALRPGGH
jgi:C4-dicarboxylate transporter, DctQ subunit